MRGYPLMYLVGVVTGTGVHILVDIGTTHVIDINVARLISLSESRIDTTMLVGSGTEVSCRATSFSVPLRIDAEIFYIDAFLLNIGNDIDIILGTPWLASLGRLTWDFTMEFEYYRNGNPTSFTTIRPRWTSATVRALLAPPPIQRVPQEAATSPPRDVMMPASHSRYATALNQVNATDAVFDWLRQVVLQQHELRHMALAVTDGTTTPAWSLDQGILFLNGRFYLPAASPVTDVTTTLLGHWTRGYSS